MSKVIEAFGDLSTINVRGSIPPVAGGAPAGEWVAEDYTTYTEVDPSSWVTKTPTVITFAMPGKAVDVYVVSDKGADHFAADFKFRVDFRVTSSVHNYGRGVIWMVANAQDDLNGIELASGSSLSIIANDGAAYALEIQESYGGVKYSDSWVYSVNTYYYLEIERDESVGTYGTLYCRVYSDSGRTNLLTTLSLALHAKVDFQYLYGLNNWNNGDSTARLDGTFENLSIWTVAA